jgi:hypothetical protein
MKIERYYQKVSWETEDTVQELAARIAKDVILKGKSEGWAGESTDKDNVAALLKDFNIHYVDDFFGTWAFKRPLLALYNEL